MKYIKGISFGFVALLVSLFSIHAYALPWSDTSHNLYFVDYDGDGEFDDILFEAKPRNVEVPYKIYLEVPSGNRSFVLERNPDGSYMLRMLAQGQSYSGQKLDTSGSLKLSARDISGDGKADFVVNQLTSPNDTFLIRSSEGGQSATLQERITSESGVTPKKATSFVKSFPEKATLVGKTVGQFSVSPTGAATYTIPINVVGGLNGHQPRLALSYSSRSGNGILGKGWSLTGLPTIHRCSSSPDQGEQTFDGVTLTHLDRLCMGGERLILVSGNNYWSEGAQYRTERDSQQVITRRDDQFEVETNHGQVKIFEQVRPEVWALSDWENEFGQSVLISYKPEIVGSSALMPEEIEYGSGKVKFDYGFGRNDIPDRYLAGNKRSLDHYLRRIQIIRDGKNVRDYELHYDYDESSGSLLLEYVQLCAYGASGASRQCALPLELAHESRSNLVSEKAFNLPLAVDKDSTADRPVIADWDGDGVNDFLANSAEDGVSVYFGSRNGQNFRVENLLPANSERYLLTPYVSNTGERGIIYLEGEVVQETYQKLIEPGYEQVVVEDNWKSLGTSCSVSVECTGYMDDRYGCLNGEIHTSISYETPQNEPDQYGRTWEHLACDAGSTMGYYPPVTETVEPIYEETPHDYKSFKYSWKKKIFKSDGTNVTKTIGSNRLCLAQDYDFDATNDFYRPLIGDFSGNGDLDIYVGLPNCSSLDVESISWAHPVGGDGADDIDFDILQGISFSFDGRKKNYLAERKDGAYQYRQIGEQEASNLITKTGLVIPSKWSIFVDVNADGLSDVVSFGQRTVEGARNKNNVYLFLNEGGGFKDPLSLGYDSIPGVDTSLSQILDLSRSDDAPLSSRIRVFDFDHNGISDLLILNGSSPTNADYANKIFALRTVVDADKQPVFEFINLGISNPNTVNLEHSVLVYDANGDSRTDILVAEGGRYHLFGQESGFGPLVNDFKTTYPSGETVRTKVDYGRLNDPEIYKFSLMLKPEYRTFSSTMNVVKSAFIPTKQLVWDKRDYNYSNAKMHFKGRGFLGFESYTETSSLYHRKTKFDFYGVGSSVEESFFPEFPYIGSLIRKVIVNTKTGNTTLVTANAWLSQTVSGDDHIQRPYLSQQVTQQYDPEGQVIGATRISKELDGLGNLRQKITEFGAGVNDPRLCVNVGGCLLSPVQKVKKETYSYTPSFPTFLESLQVSLSSPNIAIGGEDLSSDKSQKTYYSFNPLANLPYVVGKKITSSDPDGISDVVEIFDYALGANAVGEMRSHKLMSGPSVPPLNQIDDRITVYDSYIYGVYPTEVVNAEGQKENYEIDYRSGQATQVRAVDGLFTNYQYDALGRLIRETSPTGFTQTTEYQFCQKGNCPGFAQSSVIRVVQSANDDTKTVKYLDAYNREIATTKRQFDGSLSIQTTIYDDRGRINRVSEPYTMGGSPVYTDYSYSDIKDMVEVTRPDLSTASTYTFGTGQGTTVDVTNTVFRDNVDGIGEVADRVARRMETSDLQGNITSVLEYIDTGTSVQTDLVYDAKDRLIWSSVHNADGRSSDVRVSYDDAKQTQTIRDPDTGVTVTTYNSAGEVVREVKKGLDPTVGENRVFLYSYDRLGRKTEISESNVGLLGQWLYGADSKGLECGVGRLCEMSGPLFQENYSYEARSGLLSSTETLIKTSPSADPHRYTFLYDYDHIGREKRVSYPSGFAIERNYQNGYLYTVIGAGGGEVPQELWRASDYDARGQLTSTNLGNGLKVSRSFDERGRLIRSTAGVGLIASEMVQSANYGYDSFGNLTHRTEELTGFSETFGYDGLNRLVTQSVSSSTGTELHTYGYDFFGNLTTKPNVGNYQYGSYTSSDSCSDTGNYRDLGPHAVYEVGGRVYCYDEYGNQTSSSDRRISYSVIGKPVQISGEMSNASFMYGPDESRFYQRKQIGSEVMETFYVAGGLYEEEISDGLSTLKSYVDDFLIDKRGANHSQSYVLRDHLGSIDVIVNAEEGGQATVVETMSFSPFGERRLDGRVTSTLNPITDDRGFTDHEHLDEFDLTHMNGRVYDPVIGRFLAADPYVQDFKSSQSWNRYSYAWNNPLSSTDPSGYICVGLCDIDIPFTDIPMGFDLDWLSSDSSLQPVNSFLNGLVGNDFTPGAYTGSSDLDLIRYTHDEFKAEKYYNSGSHLGDIVLDQLDFSSVFDSLIEDGVLSAAGLLVKKKVPYINILDHVSDYKFAKGAGQLGREGEATASAITGVGKNTQKFTVNGRKRIPDQVNTSNISTRNPLHVTEVKNVKFQSFTRQLRDNVDLVGPGGRVDVFVRPNTKLSGPLRRANADPTNPINIRPEL